MLMLFHQNVPIDMRRALVCLISYAGSFIAITMSSINGVSMLLEIFHLILNVIHNYRSSLKS